MFSSESEVVEGSGDEAVEPDSQAFDESVNPHAEEEESAADDIQEGVMLVDWVMCNTHAFAVNHVKMVQEWQHLDGSSPRTCLASLASSRCAQIGTFRC